VRRSAVVQVPRSAAPENQRVAAPLLHEDRALDCGRKHITLDRARIRFEQAAAMVERDYEINGRDTLEDVKRRIKLHLTPYFGGRRLSEITNDEVQKYVLARTTAGAKPATINREWAILRRSYNLAKLPCPTFQPLPEKNTRKGLAAAAFERMRASIRRRPSPTFHLAIDLDVTLIGRSLLPRVVHVE
jgi:integrase